jgi:hypothetical protein
MEWISLTGDGLVDGADLQLVFNNFGNSMAAGWVPPAADIDLDGSIDGALARALGESVPGKALFGDTSDLLRTSRGRTSDVRAYVGPAGGGSAMPNIGGRVPINAALAGNTHPVTGVRFTDKGFPDFSPHATHSYIVEGGFGRKANGFP